MLGSLSADKERYQSKDLTQVDFTIDTDNKEFQEALQLISFTRQSVFLTGKAGTGKSTFLKYI